MAEVGQLGLFSSPNKETTWGENQMDREYTISADFQFRHKPNQGALRQILEVCEKSAQNDRVTKSFAIQFIRAWRGSSHDGGI